MTLAKYAIIMCRISSVKQNTGASLTEQEVICKEYCRNNDLEIIESQKAIESAFAQRRPKFDKILEIIGKISSEPIALVVASADRLARNFNHISLLDELVKADKVEIHFVKEAMVITKFSSADAIFKYRQLIANAEHFSAEKSEKDKKALQDMREKGLYPGKAPIGYKNCRPCWMPWIMFDEQADKVRHLFHIYSQTGVDIKRLLELAKSMPLYTTSGALINRRTLLHLLRNPFYCGLMHSGGKLYSHNYERLIKEDIFSAVQAKLERELCHLVEDETKMKSAA